MAQKVLIELEDDIDGSAATQTVSFSLDGADYAIDLSDDNAEGLRAELAAYIQAGRRVRGRKVRAAIGQPTTSDVRERNRAIRAWAHAHGHPVAARGRIPDDLIAAYDTEAQVPAAEKKTRTTTTGTRTPRKR